MTGHDDFEHRLGQGLKRWVQAGEPTIDLEAFVRERTGQRGTGPDALPWNGEPLEAGVVKALAPIESGAAGATGPLEPGAIGPLAPMQQGALEGLGPPESGASGELAPQASGLAQTIAHQASDERLSGRRSRRWKPWLVGVAAAAVIALALGTTFPSWAGAAAGLPLVGPVITRIIMEDAGLKWAYDMGLIQGNVAEVTQNGVTVRILGVLADSRRTIVLYQVLGAPPAERDDSPPVPTSSWVTPPERPSLPVEAAIAQVNGRGAVSSSSPPEETPLGYVGTVSTVPLELEQAELTLRFVVGEEKITLTVTASREETDRVSREVVVSQILEYDGVRITVESVVYTPAETVVRYREEADRFIGPVNWDWETEYDYLEVNGQRYRSSGGGLGLNNVHHLAFPPVEGQARLVLKPVIKGSPIEAVWPLEEGAVAEVMGVPVTLVEFQRAGDAIGFRWKSPQSEQFRGIGGFEVIDSAGNAHPLGGSWESVANSVAEGVRYQHYSAELPEGVEAVAVRATQAAVPVYGPWVFELPRG